MSDGLPDAFCRPWHAWIRRSLADGQARLGDQWEARFRACPPWRFVLARDICGPLRWAGVIASSTDQGGWLYPMTIAIALPDPAPLTAFLDGWDMGFVAMSDILLELLQTPERLDRAALALERFAVSATFPAHPPADDAVGPTATDPSAPPLRRGASVRLTTEAGWALWRASRATIARAGPTVSVMWTTGWGDGLAAIVAAGLPDTGAAVSIWEAA